MFGNLKQLIQYMVMSSMLRVLGVEQEEEEARHL